MIASSVTLLLLSCTSVFCVIFPGSLDYRFRKGLLNSLYRFHLNLPAILIENDSERKSPLPLPSLAINEIFCGFLGKKEWPSVSLINMNSYCKVKREKCRKLNAFSPHFVTEDQLVNNLLFEVLIEYFKESKTLSSPHIHDELQLLTMKVVFDQISFEVIPKNVFYCILSFFHEFVYGKDSVAPFDAEEYMIDFVRLRMRKDLSLPLSFEFISNLKHSELSHAARWKSDLSLFTFESSRVMIHEVVDENYSNLSIEFQVNAVEMFLEDFHEQMALTSMMGFCSKGIFSSFTFERFARTVKQDNERLYEMIFNPISNVSHYKYKTAAASVLKSRTSSLNNELYFYSRNSIDQFSLDEYMKIYSDPMGHLEEFIGSKSYSLAQMQMFSDLVRSFTCTNDLSHLLWLVFKASNKILFEILLKEHQIPLNIFFRDPSRGIVPVWSGPFRPSFSFMKVFVKFMKNSSKDPLILLTMNIDFIRQILADIRDKFDLNTVYTFNLRSEELARFMLDGTVIKDLAGQTMSFKEVVSLIGSSKLNEIFIDSNVRASSAISTISVNENDSYEYFTISNFE